MQFSGHYGFSGLSVFPDRVPTEEPYYQETNERQAKACTGTGQH